jgi:hypothetical protein
VLKELKTYQNGEGKYHNKEPSEAGYTRKYFQDLLDMEKVPWRKLEWISAA